MALEIVKDNAHNPDSNCVECCRIATRLDDVLNVLEKITGDLNDPNASDNMPPMLKMMFKVIGK